MSSRGPNIAAHRLGEDRRIQTLTRPLAQFVETEAAGGAILLGAVVVALAWANSPWSQSYAALWETHARLGVGPFALDETLRDWINQGLMALFFLVVGMEIKDELDGGVLSSVRRAVLPAVAAVGGMAVPAGVYLAFNPSGPAAGGWGIVMATDIALALGLLALLGPRVPDALRILLLAVAIVDDIGAIIVIGAVYSRDISLVWLAASFGGLALIVGMRLLHIWWVPAYVAVGSVVWLAVHSSGVHATIAGVLLGLLTPAAPLHAAKRSPAAGSLEEDQDQSPDEGVRPQRARLLRFKIVASVPVTDRLQNILHPWTSYVILPVFALANAGIPLGADALSRAVTSTVTLGVVAGLVAGKTLGISLGTWGASRLGADRPPEVGAGGIVGLGATAGIGFTMSLFIAELAFTDQQIADQARIGILAASAIAAVVGLLILRTVRGTEPKPSSSASEAGEPVGPTPEPPASAP